MINRSKHKQSTNRPSFKQSRSGRAYLSAQTKQSTRRSQPSVPQNLAGIQESQVLDGVSQEDATYISTLSDSAQTKTNHGSVFEVAQKQRLRWEARFIIVIILLLIVILGSGAFIAAKRSQDALTLSAESLTKTTQTVGAQSSNSGVDDNANAQSNAASTAPSGNAFSAANVVNLATRDKDFAVDPDQTEWNVMDDDRKVVYLTFDDGPSARTKDVLDILDHYGCKATFFVVGHNDEYFPMIAEAYKRGHTIGMHTYSHNYEQIYASDEAYFDDLERIAAIVKEQIGYVPAFIRFPGGSSNTISVRYNEGIMSRLVDEVRARGYQYFDWNNSFGDGADHTAEEIVSYACELVDMPKIILLCHDSATKQTTLEALPQIIEHYQSLGYTFEAIGRTTNPAHHEVSN